MASTTERGFIARLLLRKSVEQVQRETENSQLKRTLGPWNLVFLGIGCIIGAIPGLGGSVVDWIAYGHAVQTEKKDPQFGKGDIRGVIAPESANNAMQGGAPAADAAGHAVTALREAGFAVDYVEVTDKGRAFHSAYFELLGEQGYVEVQHRTDLAGHLRCTGGRRAAN